MTEPHEGRLSSRPSRRVGHGAAPAGLRRLNGPRRGPHLLFAPPAPTGAAMPLVVYFHGAGGRGEQGLPLLRDAAAERGTLILAPTSSASTWDLVAGHPGPDVDALDAVLATVFDEYPVAAVAFAGFSDGASHALSLGLANGDLVGAVLAFSPGFAAPPQRVGRPRVWLSHGTADAVLPVDRCGRRVAAVLDGAGYDVRYEEFTGGHVVPPELVPEALDWWMDHGTS